MKKMFYPILLLFGVVGCSGSGTLQVTIPQQAVQTALDSYFPMQSDEKLDRSLPARVTLSDPELVIEEETDEIGIRLSIRVEHLDGPGAPAVSGVPTETHFVTFQPPLPPLPRDGQESSGSAPGPAPGLQGRPQLQPPTLPNIPSPQHAKDQTGPPRPPTPNGQPLQGNVTVIGRLEFRPEQSAFFFLDPKIKEITFQAVPGPMEEPARQITEQLMGQYLANNAVYKMSDAEVSAKTAKMLLKNLSVEDGRLVAELGL